MSGEHCDDCGRFMSPFRRVPVYRDARFDDGTPYKEWWRTVCPACDAVREAVS